MTPGNVAPVTPASSRRACFVAAALCAALSAAGVVQAQTVPYQSGAGAMIGTGIGQMALPKGGRFEPRLEAAIQYVDNINLAQPGEKAVNTAGIELAPGFYASYSSGTMTGAIDYSLIGRVWDESDYNDVTQRLEANGEWLAVPEWFSLSGQASYGDAVIDPRASLNTGGLGIFGPNNLTEFAAASVSPMLRHRFNAFELEAQYTYGRVWYLNQGKGQPVVGFVTEQDSQDQVAHVSFGTADDDRRLSGRIYYEWQRSEYDTAIPYEFERAGFDAGLQLSKSLWLVGDVGQESDLDKSTTSGGLDSSFWSAGLRYAPSRRTSVEARYGERFFGESYSFKFTHQARVLQFDASYSEDPTVETRTLSLGQYDPGTLPPGTPPGVGTGGLNSSPYIAKNAHASVAAVGSRTRLTLSGYYDQQDYLRGLRANETRTGAQLGASRKLASNSSLDLDLSYSEFERQRDVLPQVDGSTRDYDTEVTLRLNRKASARITISGEAGYLNRSGASDYDGWWVALRARYEP